MPSLGGRSGVIPKSQKAKQLTRPDSLLTVPRAAWSVRANLGQVSSRGVAEDKKRDAEAEEPAKGWPKSLAAAAEDLLDGILQPRLEMLQCASDHALVLSTSPACASC